MKWGTMELAQIGRDLSVDIRKKYVTSFLMIIVLAMIIEKKSHGYEIISRIKNDLDVSLCPGTVYPLLYNLEEKGLIICDSNSKEKKKVYKITNIGKAYFKGLYNDLKISNKFVFNNIERKIK